MDAIEERKHNEEVFNQQLAVLKPELYHIDQVLSRTRVNPLVLPYVIEKIFEVATTTGRGTVEIFISKNGIQIESNPRSPQKDFKIEVLVINDTD